jgi:signal peptidase II
MLKTMQADNDPSPPAPAARRRQAVLFRAWLAGALLIVLADQLSKWYVGTHLRYGQRIHVLPVFDITLLYNPGAAFSFLAGGSGWQRWLFTLIALGAAGLIIHLLRKTPGQLLFCASLTAILGGAVGNVTDRLQHGHVIDFLLFYWNDWYFPAFNLADVSITCGAIVLILDEVLRMRREHGKTG